MGRRNRPDGVNLEGRVNGHLSERLGTSTGSDASKATAYPFRFRSAGKAVGGCWMHLREGGGER